MVPITLALTRVTSADVHHPRAIVSRALMSIIFALACVTMLMSITLALCFVALLMSITLALCHQS